MLRLTGSALILGAVLWLQRSFHLRTLLRQRTLRALSGAFLALESAVRLTLTPLPALLRHLSCEPEAAGFFESVTANLARGEPLASAWEHAAKTLPIAARERETVSALGHALGGDEESVCAALTLAASELSRLEEELRQRERETGRITAALVAGGAVVLGALDRAGINIVTHIGRCAGVADTPFALDDPAALGAQAEALLSRGDGFALLNGEAEEPMKAAIRAAGSAGDSVGGTLETAILGLPAGIGEPYFDSVESELAHMAFSVPAVKGIEFGTGFGFADLKGSEANDAFRMQGSRIVTATNHNAGLNGGISNGMPVVFRTVVKPTPSIYKPQDTVDYIAKQNAELSIQGRHDPCIVPRAAIVQTCAAALAVGDLLTAKYGMAWMEQPTAYRKEEL